MLVPTLDTLRKNQEIENNYLFSDALSNFPPQCPIALQFFPLLRREIENIFYIKYDIKFFTIKIYYTFWHLKRTSVYDLTPQCKVGPSQKSC